MPIIASIANVANARIRDAIDSGQCAVGALVCSNSTYLFGCEFAASMFQRCVAHIIGISTKKEMLRIDAVPHITMVADVHSLGDGADKELIRISVGGDSFSAAGKASISARIFGARPQPAPAGILINEVGKTLTFITRRVFIAITHNATLGAVLTVTASYFELPYLKRDAAILAHAGDGRITIEETRPRTVLARLALTNSPRQELEVLAASLTCVWDSWDSLLSHSRRFLSHWSEPLEHCTCFNGSSHYITPLRWKGV